ncbi:MAG: hypothetical protein WBF77_06660 [Sulfurimonadaceae bacterium]
MVKWLLLPLLTLTSLEAEGIDPDKLSEIYTEGIWFVAVFAVMSIISYIVSKRHAKQYTQKQRSAKQRVPQAVNRTDKPITTDQTGTTANKADRLAELSKLVDDGLLREEEFQLLRKNIQE